MVRVVLLACLLQVSLQTTIVIDSGSGLVKAGFAGEIDLIFFPSGLKIFRARISLQGTKLQLSSFKQ